MTKPTNQFRTEPPSIFEMMAAFNPQLSKDVISMKIENVQITDVTPAGYGPDE